MKLYILWYNDQQYGDKELLGVFDSYEIAMETAENNGVTLDISVEETDLNPEII